MSPSTFALSVGVALAIEAEKYRCWRNAVLAVLAFPSVLPTYVEGWIVLPKTTCVEIQEHGWANAADGTIIDPSLVLVESSRQEVFYFPGQQFSYARLHHVLPGATLPLICHTTYGLNGMKHEGYKHAYDLARQCAQEQAEERHLAPGAIKVMKRDPHIGMTLIVED